MKNLSIRNQLAGTIQEIVRGTVVSEVIVKTAAGTLASVITTRSVRDLSLKKGDKVFVMIKATEASIQKGRAPQGAPPKSVVTAPNQLSAIAQPMITRLTLALLAAWLNLQVALAADFSVTTPGDQYAYVING